jgi:hypothetical protein
MTEQAVLVIGLDPYRVPGPWDPGPVAAAVEDGLRELREAGFYTESCAVGLDGSDDVAAVVRAAATSRPWDCVLVGGGIRTDDELLELFEEVVNLVHRHAPQAVICFNATRDDLLVAVRRALSRRDGDSA